MKYAPPPTVSIMRLSSHLPPKAMHPREQAERDVMGDAKGAAGLH